MYDGGAVDRRQVEIHLRQRDGLFERADVGGERLRDDGRLRENLLLHEVAVIALLDRRGGHARGRNFALDRVVVGVENLRAFAANDDPIALVEISDLLRQRRKRERVAAEVGFALAVTNDEGRAEARADEQVGMAAKGYGDRKSTRLNSSH